MKVIIAGGRDFSDYPTLKMVCDYMLQNQEKVTVVSGQARGADTLGEWYAQEKGYSIDSFPADWDDMSEPCVRKINTKGKEWGVW